MELPVFGNPEEQFAASIGMVGFLKDLRKAHEDILKIAAQTAVNLKPNLKAAVELKESNPPEQIVAFACGTKS